MCVFQEFFYLFQGVCLSCSRASSDYLCTAPPTPIVTVIRG